MEVALISPFQIMREIPNTKYHLVLAHLLADKRYRAFELAVEGYKILDNGVVEGKQTTAEELIALATAIGANEIVVPDTPRNAVRTMRQAQDFEHIAKEHPEFKYMGVIQGADHVQREHVLDMMQHLGYFSIYALPRNAVVDGLERAAFASELYGIDKSIVLHALGSSAWAEEARVLANQPNVRGMDTAMPIKMALDNQVLGEGANYRVYPHNWDYFTEDIQINDTRWSLIHGNLRTFLGWAKAPSAR